jgi:hypothetical protein
LSGMTCTKRYNTVTKCVFINDTVLHLQASVKFIETHIENMKPKAVVIGDGLWFVWFGRR